MNLYLDWAAAAIPETRLILRETQQACTLFANPSAVHCLGNDARDALERARHTCAQSLGINPERLIFTSGGSEANQLALLSVLTRLPHAEISVSMLEHASVTALLPRLERLQVSVRHIPVNARGFITPEAVRATLSPRTTLVCVSAVHSETGAIQPLPAIAHVLAHT
ncbi:aminotransferase class V-fold PLP-dependent enzyme, partial [Treponema pallidum]